MTCNTRKSLAIGTVQLLICFFLSNCRQPKKSPPKKAKPSRDISSDEEPLETAVPARGARTSRAKAPVKYFDGSGSDSDEKENTKDWSGSDSDFDDE